MYLNQSSSRHILRNNNDQWKPGEEILTTTGTSDQWKPVEEIPTTTGTSDQWKPVEEIPTATGTSDQWKPVDSHSYRNFLDCLGRSVYQVEGINLQK